MFPLVAVNEINVLVSVPVPEILWADRFMPFPELVLLSRVAVTEPVRLIDPFGTER